MTSDVRIDPEETTARVGGSGVRVLALLLGGVPRGAAVVVAGPDGLDDMAAIDTMNHLAQHGYESLLALPADPADAPAAGIVDHLVARLAERGWQDEQIGVIGHGAGARAALVAAAARSYGAAVSIPRDPLTLLVPDAITDLRTAWIGLVGQGDSAGLTGELAAYRDALRERAPEHTALVGYPGADHCLRDSTDPREHAAAFDAWQRTAEWLDIHVVPRPTPFALAWRERQRSLQPST